MSVFKFIFKISIITYYKSAKLKNKNVENTKSIQKSPGFTILIIFILINVKKESGCIFYTLNIRN